MKKKKSIVRRPKTLLEGGNIDLTKRPRVKNPGGSVSSLRSKSYNIKGKETLIPTVREDGWYMSDKEALKHYKKTGKHLGKFKTPKGATEYSKRLSKHMSKKK